MKPDKLMFNSAAGASLTAAAQQPEVAQHCHGMAFSITILLKHV
jgi:hypothetical protein